jgi:hypothetical protein
LCPAAFLIAYGFHRDDFSYIPGGVMSASFMQPGFMDLSNFPYYFNQTEHVIHGVGPYIFDVLAARWMLLRPPAADEGRPLAPALKRIIIDCDIRRCDGGFARGSTGEKLCVGTECTGSCY